MTSIRHVQTERLIEDITRLLYTRGVKPTTTEILQAVSSYFSSFTAGQPLPLPLSQIEKGEVADPNVINLILSHTAYNLDVLYEVVLQHIEDLMDQNTALRVTLDTLQSRRKRIEDTIDNYLLSQYNTDGYYYSISDTFSDLSLTDLSNTSAYVDLKIGSVTLPALGTYVAPLPGSVISLVSIRPQVDNVAVDVSRRTSEFSNAVDGLQNTAWAFEIHTDKKAEVVVRSEIVVGGSVNVATISRIEYLPFGTSPVTAFFRTKDELQDAGGSWYGFGNSIKTSAGEALLYTDNKREATRVELVLRKTEPDYVTEDSGAVKYHYVFGARDLSFYSYTYDNIASFVSTPLRIPHDISGDMVIDAVSLVVDENAGVDTDIKYYVASDNGSQIGISDFDWRPIDPVNATDTDKSTIIRFDGARFTSQYIKHNPRRGDITLIAEDDTNVDLAKRNPSQVIYPGLDIYRLAQFTDQYITGTLQLEEGVDSTRIYSTNLSADAVNGLDFWATLINGSSSVDVAYGSVNTGKGFFYGGDIGASGKSVYVETYLESIDDRESFISEFRKDDPNSRLWTVRILLNGRSIGYLPPGTDMSLVSWSLKRGLNHIALLINIPQATTAYPNPYIGTVTMMADSDLSDFGTVKLDTWNYVDSFDMQYNQLPESKTFTINDGEIVSRRRPTTNFRLQYQKATNSGPSAMRLRVDLSRSVNNPHVTPILNSYRMRFSFGNT